MRHESSVQGPNAELVVGHSRELVIIAYEGASYYVDSRLLKIGDRGSPVDIPQHKVIDGQKVIGRTVDRRHLFLVCRDSEREDQSGLLGERPQDLSRLRVDDGDSLVHRARDLSSRAVSSAQRAEEKEAAALYEADAAQWEALFGFAAEARERARAALSHWKGRDVEFGAALGLALANNAHRGQAELEKLADDLAMRFPEDTLARFNYLPTLRAQIALNRGNPSQALEVLEVSAPYELGMPGGYGFPQALLPVFVRGEAYLAAHRGPEAVAEFQKVLNHPGIVFNEPIGALAHLQLGRAYALSGDDTKARSGFQDFLSLWKDADPDVPILKEARAEYAKLE